MQKNIVNSICHKYCRNPSDIVPNDFIKNEIVGKIEYIKKDIQSFLITVSY